ncbi:MAG TPA: chemotaxis protein CheC [Methanomassiliicoccales archaeon]|jgi:chemotaxis protein CheC|nr:chemotaxis protein CheC [Methanomassiliicoccales archaeon]
MIKATAKKVQIDDLQMDALREVGVVGASYASKALARLSGREVVSDRTECHVFPDTRLPRSIGSPGDIFAGVTIDVQTDPRTRILMLFPKDVATVFSDKLFGRSSSGGRPPTNEDREALVEMGDICIREYLIPITKFLRVELMPNAPVAFFDRIGPEMAFPASLIKLHAPYSVRIQTDFVDAQRRLQCCIFFLPDSATQDLTFRRFGVDLETQAQTFKRLSPVEEKGNAVQGGK